MIIDMHAHIGADKDGTTATIEELKKSMSSCGITGSVIFPFDEKSEDLIGESLKLLDKKEDGLYPFLRFDPLSDDCERIEAAMGKFYGVKLHPRAQNFDPLDKRVYKIYELIQKHQKPVIIHTRLENTPNTDPDRIADLAEIFPSMKIILAHFAGLSGPAFEKVAKYPNLFVETSIISSNVVIGMKAQRLGADKVLFGSDWPYSDQEIELLKIKKSGLPESDKEKILFKNEMKMLKLDI